MKPVQLPMANSGLMSGLMGVVCWAAVTLPAAAVETFTATVATEAPSPAQKPKKASKTKQTKAPKVRTDLGAGETTAERDKRLWRECRGRPNAGACEGYAN